MQASITTYEYDSDLKKWVPVLSHTFYGEDKREIKAIIETHKKTDVFFAGSFEGKWEDIKLKNSKIQYE